MMRPPIPTALLGVACTALALSAASAQSPSHTPQRAEAAATLRTDMRKLWSDHVVWTRQYIVSAVAALPDTQAAAERLLRNQSDIGDAIKPYYGEDAGRNLTALLRGHITVATEVVRAARAGDNAQVGATSLRWQANADSIAAFLSQANPRNWPEDRLKAELRRHLELTTQAATLRLRRDWQGDARNYDAIYDQALAMADMLAEGITRQFPAGVASGRR